MANPSRRSVLRAGVVAAAAAVPLAATQNAMSVVAGGMASGMRRSTFKPHVRTSFKLVGAGAAHSAKLVEVADLAAAPTGHDTKFRLLFRVRSKPAEGTYRLRHGRVAAMDLFLAPVGRSGDLYEAVIDAR